MSIISKQDKDFIKQMVRNQKYLEGFESYEDMQRFINLMVSYIKNNYNTKSWGSIHSLIQDCGTTFNKDEDGNYDIHCVTDKEKFLKYCVRYFLNKSIGLRNTVKILFSSGKVKTFTLPTHYYMIFQDPSQGSDTVSKRIKYGTCYEIREIYYARNAYGYVEGFVINWIPYIPLDYPIPQQPPYAPCWMN